VTTNRGGLLKKKKKKKGRKEGTSVDGGPKEVVMPGGKERKEPLHSGRSTPNGKIVLWKKRRPNPPPKPVPE